MGVHKELGLDNQESLHQLGSPQNVDHPATANAIRNTAGLEFLSKLSSSIPSRRCAATELTVPKLPRPVFKSKKVLLFGAMEDIRNDKYLARS